MHLYSYIQTSSKIQEFIDWNLHVSQETEARYEFSICNSGDELECRKCWPISLLPNFNRLIEKMMYKKVKAFFTKFDVLCSSQYWWFQGSYTIEYTLLHIVIKIKTNMDAKFSHWPKKDFWYRWQWIIFFINWTIMGYEAWSATGFVRIFLVMSDNTSG